jgi:pilus assembly protein CpaC
MCQTCLHRRRALLWATASGIAFALHLLAASPFEARGQAVIQKIEAASERVELTANTSRILTLDHKIPRAQVNNPELVALTPLSPNQVQISAKKPGVTQVNLWADQGRV